MHSRILVFGILILLATGCQRATPSGPTSSNAVSSTPTEHLISSSETNAAEPAIAADASGNVLVAWVEHGDKSASLMLRKFDPQSKPTGTVVKVNPDATNVKAWRGDPPTIAIGTDGTIYVGWNRANGEKGNDLVLSASRDGGATFDAPVKVNDDTAPASHGMHSLAIGKDGRIYMAWLDERNVKAPGEASGTGHHAAAEPNSETYFSSSSDGGRTFAPNKRLASEVCPCCKTTVLASPDGRVYVAWRQVLPGDFRHVAVAVSGDSGETFSQGVIVSDDKWKINACPVSGAALAMGEGNVLDVAWYTAGDAGQSGLYTARSTDGGKTFSSRNLVSNEAVSGTPTIINASGEMKIAFAVNGSKIEIRDGASNTISMSDALYPVAVRAGNHDYVCFVRKSGEKSSVWLSSVGS